MLQSTRFALRQRLPLVVCVGDSESMSVSSPNVFLRACEGLQLRGSSADQAKRSLFRDHLREEGH